MNQRNLNLVGAPLELPSEGSLQATQKERTSKKRRKVVRSERACEICRVSKKGCRGGRPCRRCIKMGIGEECFFTVPKRRGRKGKEKVLEFCELNRQNPTSKQANRNPTQDGTFMFSLHQSFHSSYPQYPQNHSLFQYPSQFEYPSSTQQLIFQSTLNSYHQENEATNVVPLPPHCCPPLQFLSPPSISPDCVNQSLEVLKGEGLGVLPSSFPGPFEKDQNGLNKYRNQNKIMMLDNLNGPDGEVNQTYTSENIQGGTGIDFKINNESGVDGNENTEKSSLDWNPFENEPLWWDDVPINL